MQQQILSRVKRLVVKVGSAVMTTAEGLNVAFIDEFADSLATLQGQGRQVVIVSSGAIAAGFKKIGLPGKPTAIPQKQAVAAIGQSTLMQHYEQAFARHGLKVAQILLTRNDLAHRRRYLNARNTLFTLLNWQVIPVINENDTVVVEEIQFGDNDNLSALISSVVQADLLIILTDIDGLYDKDPRHHPDACRLPLVEKIDARLERAASRQPGVIGSGGMFSKIQAAKKAGSVGIPTIIASGLKPHIIPTLFAGEPEGTLFLPQTTKLRSRQYWLAYTTTPAGDIIVDDGARQVLRFQGKSLLPAGVVGVQGRFSAGAPVRLLDTRGEVIGIGLSNYSANDLACIKGLKTCNIQQSLGYKGYDEVVHRDNMVIFQENI
ncbi:MAG: glutamate 5-kinase [Desulfobacca sp.]|uniref:glutamate 5-kinase n=1 Tax=Desulfobacca sp. TaxID=2067990 RepID=UPI00404AA4FE